MKRYSFFFSYSKQDEFWTIVFFLEVLIKFFWIHEIKFTMVVDDVILRTSKHLKLTGLAYFLSTFRLRLLVAVAFPWGARTSVDVAVWASSEIIVMTRQKVVPWQQRLCPETTHAVLTAGEQNVAHCASAHGDGGREKKSWQRIHIHICVSSHVLVYCYNFQKHRFYDRIVWPNNVSAFLGQRVTSSSGVNTASRVANVWHRSRTVQPHIPLHSLIMHS